MPNRETCLAWVSAQLPNCENTTDIKLDTREDLQIMAGKIATLARHVRKYQHGLYQGNIKSDS